jgi:amino acid transporter
MTVKQLGVLNRYRVPGNAMSIDMIVNICFVLFIGNIFGVLAASNLGYVLAHMFALSGFVLLRRDRPNWPRPIKLAAAWMPIAALLAAVNLALIVVGGFIYSGGFLGIDTQYGYGWDKTRIGLIVLAVGLLLYIWRHVVEDRTPLRLREETPDMPPAAERPTAAPAT